MLKDKYHFLTKVIDFLGIDRRQLSFVPQDALTKEVNKGIEITMPKEIYDDLHELYRHKILSLQNYLGKDLTQWLSQ